MKVLKFLFLTSLAAVGLCVLITLCVLGWWFNNNLQLVEESVAFQLLQPDASPSVLVVGDSTGVGTGAALPSASVAGRIAQHYDCASVVNRARDGATTKDVVAQLRGTAHTGFELALIQVGANDILRFTNSPDLTRAAAAAFKRATVMADHVVLIDTSNVSAAPVFLPPFEWLLTPRAQAARRLFMDAAAVAGVEYVDISAPAIRDALERTPEQYYASDRLHPDGEGYGLWYRALMQQSRIESILEC